MIPQGVPSGFLLDDLLRAIEDDASSCSLFGFFEVGAVGPYGEVAGGPGLGAIVMCCSERGFGERLRLGGGSGRGHVGVPGRQGGRVVKSLVPL